MAGFHSTDVSDLPPDFVVDEVLRSGGTAMLVRVRPRRGGSAVVLKILLAAHMDVPDLRSRFEREAEALALVRSPHVPELRGTGFTTIGRPYLILEALDGRDLEDELDALGRLPVSRFDHGPLHVSGLRRPRLADTSDSARMRQECR